jgi:hypothetical protein
MEQSGRNRWQPVANGTAAKAAQIGEKRCRGLRPVAAGNGKEGVDGSSPSEGFVFSPAQPVVPLSFAGGGRGCGVHATSTSVHRGLARR